MKNKVKQKMISAVAIAAAFLLGISPMTAFAQTSPEPELEPELIEETYGPLTPDGNLSLVDDYGSMEAGGKQFITVVTKKGNYFYIIIDRDDKGEETVHFLNMVDETDLMKLMDDEEAQTYLEPVVTEEKDIEKTEVVEEPEENIEVEIAEPVEKESNIGILLLILVAGITSMGGYMYLKISNKKKVKKQKLDPDVDYVEEEENYLAGLLEEDDFEESELLGEEFIETDEN